MKKCVLPDEKRYGIACQSKKQAIKVTDLLLIKSAGDVEISPDGQFAL